MSENVGDSHAAIQVRSKYLLVSQSNLWQGDSGSSRSLALVRCFPSSRPRSTLSDFLILSFYYSGVCLLLLFHTYCSYARGILCGTHTSCMDPPSLQSMFKRHLYFEAKWLNSRSVESITKQITPRSIFRNILVTYCDIQNCLFDNTVFAYFQYIYKERERKYPML